jgi:8-oxo-dGTP pyrophosphatase MutT (NUDIX family)
VPLFRDDEDEQQLVLVVRGPLGRHAHQLSLPGGKHEPGDASLLETALRETEEIGLTRDEIEVASNCSRFRLGRNRGASTAWNSKTDTYSGDSCSGSSSRCFRSYWAMSSGLRSDPTEFGGEPKRA